jgi:hypothetical protein
VVPAMAPPAELGHRRAWLVMLVGAPLTVGCLAKGRD